MRHRIVIAEQDFDVYETMREYLHSRGHKVSWAKTGPDAVRIAAQEMATLVFADALAPELSGLKICRQVKDANPETKTVLIVSIYREDAETEEGFDGLVDGSIDKPVSRDRLEQVMYKLFPPRRMQPPDTRIDPVSPEEATPIRRRIGLSGSLADTPLAKVLFFLHRYGRTGCLTLTRAKATRKIYLREGQPVYVTSNAASDSLGRYLLSTGKIRVEQYNDVLETMVESGREQSAVLIAKGLVSPHDLYGAMRALTKEKVLAAFGWDDGEYAFARGEFRIGGENLTPLPVYPLIFEGIRRFYNLTRLESFFSRYKRHVPETEPSPDDAGLAVLGPAQSKIVAGIDGKTTLGRIVTTSTLTLSQTFQVLYYLMLIDRVRFVGVRPAGPKKDRARSRRAGIDPRAMANYEALVQRTYRMLPDLDHFQVLGLTNGASADEIRAAYLTMTRQFRPYQLFDAASPIVREKAQEIFDRLTAASETLLSPEGHQAYVDGLAGGERLDELERRVLSRVRGETPVEQEPAVEAPPAVQIYDEPAAAPDTPPAPAPPEPPIARDAEADEAEVPIDLPDAAVEIEDEEIDAFAETDRPDAGEDDVDVVADDELVLAEPDADDLPDDLDALSDEDALVESEPEADDLPELEIPDAVDDETEGPIDAFEGEPEPARAAGAFVVEEPELSEPEPPVAAPEIEADRPEASAVRPADEPAARGGFVIEGADRPEDEPARRSIRPHSQPSSTAIETDATPREHPMPAAPEPTPDRFGLPAAPAEGELPPDLDFDIFEHGDDPPAYAPSVDVDAVLSSPADEWTVTEPDDDLADLLAEGVRVTNDMAQLMRGELKFQEGEERLAGGDFRGAAEAFQEAITASPHEAEYRALLGWSLFNVEPDDPGVLDRSMTFLEEALELNPGLDRAHYFLGRIALSQQAYGQARAHFERALASNPSSRDAADALQKLEGVH